MFTKNTTAVKSKASAPKKSRVASAVTTILCAYNPSTTAQSVGTASISRW
ncbi:MAG: hypothetical protein ACSHXY_01410 [Alphaproteobacteria bacterium]